MTPENFEHDNEGKTPANWTGAAIVTLAFIVGTLGVVLAQPLIFWIGVVILAAGMVTWKVMLGMETPAASEDVG
jgi:hypothetical protein